MAIGVHRLAIGRTIISKTTNNKREVIGQAIIQAGKVDAIQTENPVRHVRNLKNRRQTNKTIVWSPVLTAGTKEGSVLSILCHRIKRGPNTRIIAIETDQVSDHKIGWRERSTRAHDIEIADGPNSGIVTNVDTDGLAFKKSRIRRSR